MSIFGFPEVSLEAIAPQVTRLLHMELTNCIAESRGAGKLDAKRMSNIVSRHTHMSANFNIDNSAMPNAYVIPPRIDKNNPLINDWRKYLAQNTDGITAINMSGGPVSGGVNLEKGQVSGVFEKVNFDIFITRGAFDKFGTLQLTPAELSAMIIHELGHVFTYFMTLGQSFRTCFYLQGFVREAMKTNEKEQRYKLIRDFQEGAGVTITDPETVSESDNEKVITTLVLSDIVEASRSQYGTSLYDMRSWETLSDQYASRNGASADLATALQKLYGEYDPMYSRGTFKFLMVEILKTIAIVFVTLVSVMSGGLVTLFLVFLVLSASPYEREYDNPVERVTKLRNDLISQLKQEKNKERTSRLINDIEVVNQTLESMKEHVSFFERFWLIISPYTRRQVRAGKEIQELEKLVNNDIFISAAKLKGLA